MVPNGWTHGLFNDGIELISGQHVDAKFVNNSGIGKPYLTGPADFPDGKIIVTKYTEHAKKECLAGDLLITVKGSGTGKVIEADGSYAISRQLMAIRATKFDSKFCFYNLVASVKRYEDAAAGLIPGISRDDVLNTPIMVPPLPEQRKIAKILSTWDKAITTTEQLIAASQQQKKALMQQLLTGKKRLVNPETGKAFEGEWEEVHVSDIATTKKGKALSAKDIVVGKYPVIAGGKSSPYTHNNFTHENAITISASGAYAGYVSYHPYKIWASDCSVIEAKVNNCLGFIFQWLLLNQNRIYSMQSGGAQPHIYPKDIDVLRLRKPQFDEQQKIASVLTAADKEIEVLEAKLAHFKQEKKALMQQLLTGKRRVKVDDMEAA